MWNAGHSQTSGSPDVSVWNTEDWNSVIAPNGGTAEFGFNANYSGTNGMPAQFWLNGELCSSASTAELRVDYSVRDQQNNSFTTDVTITNNSDVAVNGWTLTFTFPGNQEIYEAWGVGYSQAGTAITIWNTADWTTNIPPGASITFGFNAHYSGENGVPTDLVVTPTSHPDVTLPANVVVNNDWGSGYCAIVTVTNNTGESADWNTAFQAGGTIYNFWNVIWSQAGNQVTAEGLDWNNILQPGESTHDIGFCANR